MRPSELQLAPEECRRKCLLHLHLYTSVFLFRSSVPIKMMGVVVSAWKDPELVYEVGVACLFAVSAVEVSSVLLSLRGFSSPWSGYRGLFASSRYWPCI